MSTVVDVDLIRAREAAQAATVVEASSGDADKVLPAGDVPSAATADEDQHEDVKPEAAADPDPFPPEEERPAFVVLAEWAEHQGRKYKPGTYYCYLAESKGKDAPPPRPVNAWFASPIHVEAVTHDAQANNFGRLLNFRATTKRWRQWSMPMELLKGDGSELRGALLSMGVEFDHRTVRERLPLYLGWRTPDTVVRCALQTGWNGSSFVLPDKVIGPDEKKVIFQSGESGHDEHTVAGKLGQWRDEIASKATGNPMLTLALSAGFAGPLLARCCAEGGGIHFVGDSSTGKTTLIEAACSIWGGPNYRRSWRATANGMEGAAALFNDCLLALDEISEADPREVGAIVYALGNGRGKQRASRSGAARDVIRWRCFVLSSGERTIETTMAEGGYRAKAGQSVRMLNVPVVQAMGAWDQLRGAASAAAFSDAIKRAAARFHGTAGRAYLEKLTRDKRDLGALLEGFKETPGFADTSAEGQAKRAAARFALVGLAGELATEYGITGWPEGAAIAAAAEAFKLWRGQRGGGNDERRQVAERMSDFLERHGDGRFSNVDSEVEAHLRDRAGWWRQSGDSREYRLTAEAMREAIKGFDFQRGLALLQELGALPAPDASGKRSRFFRIGGRGMRLYPVNPDKLAEAQDKLAGAAHGA